VELLAYLLGHLAYLAFLVEHLAFLAYLLEELVAFLCLAYHPMVLAFHPFVVDVHLDHDSCFDLDDVLYCCCIILSIGDDLVYLVHL
jgi:hypothetical protein